jgi:threonine/homoserine/homoserine lactone efflux protein
MNLYVFFQTFYLVFIILASVGPGFITIANIAITRGYKTSAIAVCGCFTGDCILITLGALCAKEAVQKIPQTISVALSFFAVILLFYMAIKFWKTDINNLKARNLDKKNGLSLAITLFFLKMSSPISIVGYGIIFSQVINSSQYLLSSCTGGYFASCVVNTLMVLIFGKIGTKINTKILSFINKFSATFISGFAIFVLVNSIISLTK